MTKIGKIAVQQALREMGATYKEIAALCNVSQRNAWKHCNRAAKCRAWNERSAEEKNYALDVANDLRPVFN
jgi:DNA-directed RNA polymerase specialized sigma24 family protein